MKKRWSCLKVLNKPDANLRMKYESTNEFFPPLEKEG